MYAPLNAEQINILAGNYNPSPVKAYNNQTFAFWERALFQRALSVLDITLPDSWKEARDFFYFCLFRYGYVGVFDHSNYGVIFNPVTLSGYDLYYRPTKALCANPAFNTSLELEIGKDCEILKLTPDYIGVYDIVEYYAEKLSTLDNAINMSLINCKFGYLLAAKNKQASESLKKALDLLNKGLPAVIVDQKVQNDPNDKTIPWQFINRGNLKDSYLTTQQLQDAQTLLKNFDTEIGIPTLPVEKKERMITDEARSKEIESGCRLNVWLDCFNNSAIKVNERFGLNISAKESFKLERGASDETNDDRAI